MHLQPFWLKRYKVPKQLCSPYSHFIFPTIMVAEHGPLSTESTREEHVAIVNGLMAQMQQAANKCFCRSLVNRFVLGSMLQMTDAIPTKGEKYLRTEGPGGVGPAKGLRRWRKPAAVAGRRSIGVRRWRESRCHFVPGGYMYYSLMYMYMYRLLLILVHVHTGYVGTYVAKGSFRSVDLRRCGLGTRVGDEEGAQVPT